MDKSFALTKYVISLLLFFALAAVGELNVNAQSQALNGQIEGIITDANAAAVTGATVTALNTQTGTERKATTDESGGYRFPLLPLGTFRVTVEAPNFKRLVREGINLVAGQTATVDISLEVGGMETTVTITSDAPIADPGKIDVGRVMNTREITDLPLVSRNPYNFSLLQANVVGRPNTEFGVPRVSANGYARRTNFQLDGNVNTQANQAGLRLVPISETFISEVQLVTNGFSAEFGNTPGLVMNNITPSGTNSIHGSLAYRFRRSWLTSRSFNTSPTDAKAPNPVDDYTVAVGGPIIKDRWHIYGGYEYVNRDFSGRPAQVVQIKAADRQQLIASGLPADIFVPFIPASQKVNFFIVRSDAQLTKNHRLTVRFIKFTNFSPNNVGGGLNTLQRTQDLDDKSDSLAIQLASTFGSNVFNEFRYQRAHRKSTFLPNKYTPTGPAITITNVAAFGPATSNNTISPIETMNQFQDNITWTHGDHQIKFGGGLNHIYDFRRNDIGATYTFPSIAAYLLAKNGGAIPAPPNNPCPSGVTVPQQCYTSFVQNLGNSDIEYKSVFYNFFAQDDWKATRKLKLNYGLRYDLYAVPKGDPSSPLVGDQKFNVDKNNFAPRLGAVYALRDGNRPTVLRASAGIYYDTVYLVMYENAIQANGTGRYLSVTRNPSTQASTAPLFPTVLPANASLTALGITQEAQYVSPDFKNMYAIHYQAQIEQALTTNLSLTVGFIHSDGRQLPVYRQVNYLPIPGRFLADGRPVYSINTRVNPAFNTIIEVGSGGNSRYNAMTLQLNKRFSEGYQFNFNYTLSKVRDDAPERNLQGVNTASQSDPSNRRFDRAYGIADQRHTFSGSFVARPRFSVGKVLGYILNNNQFGFTAFAGSGETFPITTNADLNGDGIGNDIPVGFERNAGRAPGFWNVDFRASRIIPITERFKIELVAEATNIFNHNSTITYGSGTTITSTNTANPFYFDRTTGIFTGSRDALYSSFTRTAQESRQGQLGIKFIF